MLPARGNQHIHLIGIGGSGLSAIARLLMESGYTVSGSDRQPSVLAQELAAAGAQVFTGHAAGNVQGADIVVRSSAVPDNNVEVLAAQAAGIPVLKRAEFLNQLLEGQDVYAIAGTHGKTTTTAMLAWVFQELGVNPSYIIGGTAKNLGGKNAHYGGGLAFVIEADEYDRMFLGLKPSSVIITYIEHDHPDCFPTPQEYYAAFVDFIQGLRPGGLLITTCDSPEARRLAGDAPHGARVFTYGTDPAADYTAKDVAPNSLGGFDFRVYYKRPAGEEYLTSVRLQVPGEHNVRNALAVLSLIHAQNASEPGMTGEIMTEWLSQASHALQEFQGTGRRFDVIGEVDGITVIDDYAHHPTKVQATLAAARARYPQRRIWAVWQPHTYSRTLTFMDDFASSFSSADRVIVTEVYAAREKAQDFDNFSAARVVERMDHPGAQFIPALEDTSRYLLQNLQPGDVLLVLSAGDADRISAQVLAGLKERKGAND